MWKSHSNREIGSNHLNYRSPVRGTSAGRLANHLARRLNSFGNPAGRSRCTSKPSGASRGSSLLELTMNSSALGSRSRFLKGDGSIELNKRRSSALHFDDLAGGWQCIAGELLGCHHCSRALTIARRACERLPPESRSSVGVLVANACASDRRHECQLDRVKLRQQFDELTVP